MFCQNLSAKLAMLIASVFLLIQEQINRGFNKQKHDLICLPRQCLDDYL